MTGLPRLYGELADWWPLLSEPSHYEEEAGKFAEAIEASSARPVRTVLELGSGGGNNASHLKRRYEMTLTDLSSDMLSVSRRLNPECEHVQGDMRTLRLGRRFDAVFVHDAVAYITDEDDLGAVMRTAHDHLEPGGVALFVPDDTLETFQTYYSTGGHDGGGKGLRYLEWLHEPKGTTVEITFVYILREHDTDRVEADRHLVGLFPRATWLKLLERAGLQAHALPYEHSTFAVPHEMFVGVKTVATSRA